MRPAFTRVADTAARTDGGAYRLSFKSRCINAKIMSCIGLRKKHPNVRRFTSWNSVFDMHPDIVVNRNIAALGF
ncbi:hypothetical protein CEXT_582881 [Caerostris extrusa]|uniref:Uncharacterized protein n=1 Tax=Caerostris extrusa TaxID=172846 RepID=A0AAV4MXQ9_CAEEX|nr:hypothetical protein CEXT_582881 [Caerostris extrusa]